MGILGGIAAVMAWLGWFALAPALGLPTFATAAMVNRDVASEENPDYWLGWLIVLLGLAAAVGVYLLVASRFVKSSVWLGLLYGLVLWLVAGAVVMPVLAWGAPTSPPPPPLPPGTPPPPQAADPMHASFMMLDLSEWAPVGAAVAWLLFGGILGAISFSNDAGAHVRKRRLGATLVTTAAAVFAVLAVPAQAARTEMLAQGPIKTLPPGGSLLSIVDLPQPPGASLGPHGHVPGFVFVLSGKAKIVDNGSEVTLSRGEGHFIPALAAHTHKNSDDRLPAGALALGLVIAVIVLLLVARSPRTRVLLMPVLLAAIIAGGAIALWDPWENDWFFIGVRPESARGAPMPTPSATRTYESPQFSNVPAGPYVESLATTTIDPHDEIAAAKAPGPVVFLVLDGRAEVSVGNEVPIRLGHHQATLVQAGESFRVLNPSGEALRLLRFALTPVSG